MENEELKNFNHHLKDFRNVDASVVGVCSASPASFRMFVFRSLYKFPIISDMDGDFSTAYGVDGQLSGSGRALVILDQEGWMVDTRVHNEYTRSYPMEVVKFIKQLKSQHVGNDIDGDGPSMSINSPDSRSRSKQLRFKQTISASLDTSFKDSSRKMIRSSSTKNNISGSTLVSVKKTSTKVTADTVDTADTADTADTVNTYSDNSIPELTKQLSRMSTRASAKGRDSQ